MVIILSEYKKVFFLFLVLKQINHCRILVTMNRLFLISLFLFGCTPPNPEPFIPPTLKESNLKNNFTNKELLTDYDIWEFLKDNPKESEVIKMFGSPDSVWVSDNQSYYILYYYQLTLQDYNFIELDTKSREVTGYEWDE